MQMAIMFLVQAIRLYLQSEKCSANVQSVLLRAAVCAMIVAVFFALRVSMLLIRPVGNTTIPNDVFFWFTYYVPEFATLIMSLVVHWFRVTQTPMSIGYGEREARKSHGGGVGPRGASTSARRTVGGDLEAGQNGGGGGGANGDAAGSGSGDGGGAEVRSGSQSGPRGVANSSSARLQSTEGETEPDYDVRRSRLLPRSRAVSDRMTDWSGGLLVCWLVGWFVCCSDAG